MLTIDPPYYSVRGVTIFRDHGDADQFYYLPSAVALARTGPGQALAFTLYKYRRDLTDNPLLDPTKARGGGLALIETEMPLAKPEAVRADLSSQAQRPTARLDPVFFRSGIVHALAAHSSGDAMIEDLVESSAAPLASPYHAAFALALTPEGATLFEAAAKGGPIPAGVVYEMRFLALTPSLHARVTMDYDRMYDHFSASVGFTIYYVSARLDADLSWLVEHDFVHIEITAFTDGADRDRQQDLVMNLVKARVQNDFFRSGIPPDPPDGALTGPLAQLLGGLAGSKTSSSSALFVLKAKLEVVKEQKTFEMLFDGQTAVELTHVCSGFVSAMVAGAPEPAIKEIDTDDPFFSELKVTIISAVDFAALADLKQASLEIIRGAQREGYALNAAQNGPFTFQSNIDRPDHDEYQYHVEYHFDPDAGSGPVSISAGPFTSKARVLTVDPLVHFRYRRIQFTLGPIDAALVPRVHISLEIRDELNLNAAPQKAEIVLNSQAPQQTWRFRQPNDADPVRIYASTAWEDPQGQLHANDDRSEITGETLSVLGPYQDVMKLSVIPAVSDWTATIQMQVEITYGDGDYHFDRTLLFDAAHKETQTFAIPLLHKTQRSYQWRQVVSRKDGTIAQTDWAAADQALLVVGGEKKTTADVRVVWVGAPNGALGMRVDFWVEPSSDPAASLFLAPGQDKVLTIPLDPDGRVRYRYAIQRVTAQGEEPVKTDTGDTTLVVIH
jgi:hypothetical protein